MAATNQCAKPLSNKCTLCICTAGLTSARVRRHVHYHSRCPTVTQRWCHHLVHHPRARSPRCRPPVMTTTLLLLCPTRCHRHSTCHLRPFPLYLYRRP